MKTSSTILVAIVAAALGAYGTSLLAPAKVTHTEHAEEKKPEKPNDHVEQDEHGADRIRISDVKLAAAGVVLAEAASATLTALPPMSASRNDVPPRRASSSRRRSRSGSSARATAIARRARRR